MKFLLHQNQGAWWFTIVGRNGRTIVTSETYKRRAGVLNAIDALVSGKLGAAPIEESAPKRKRNG